MAADCLFANALAAELFPEAPSPYRHVAAAVRSHHGTPVDLGGNLGVWKVATVPLRNAGEIGWRGAQAPLARGPSRPRQGT
jgi:hypothetical protein